MLPPPAVGVAPHQQFHRMQKPLSWLRNAHLGRGLLFPKALSTGQRVGQTCWQQLDIGYAASREQGIDTLRVVSPATRLYSGDKSLWRRMILEPGIMLPKSVRAPTRGVASLDKAWQRLRGSTAMVHQGPLTFRCAPLPARAGLSWPLCFEGNTCQLRQLCDRACVPAIAPVGAGPFVPTHVGAPGTRCCVLPPGCSALVATQWHSSGGVTRPCTRPHPCTWLQHELS